jgi:hypothetical protein
MGKYLAPPLAPTARKWPSRIINRPQGSGWLEPESAANLRNKPKYPFNKAQTTESGHSFEMDDTRGRERIRLQHRTGTFIEMHPNGDEVHKVYGDGYEITVADKNVLIEGHCSVQIKGDSVLNIDGDYTIAVAKDFKVHAGGRLTLTSEGDAQFYSRSDTSIGGGGDIAGASGLGGSLRLATMGDLFLTGSLTVQGKITCDTLAATTAVDGLQVTAGVGGFSSVAGGLAIGQPVAIPGTINCTGIVYGSIGSFGTMMAVWMTDRVNTTLFNSHFHIAKTGPTSTSPIPMF